MKECVLLSLAIVTFSIRSAAPIYVCGEKRAPLEARVFRLII